MPVMVSLSKAQKMFKKNGYTFKGSYSIKIALLPFWKEVYSKRKEFAPFGSVFSFRKDPFSEGGCVQESKQEVTKVVSLIKTAENVPCTQSP